MNTLTDYEKGASQSKLAKQMLHIKIYNYDDSQLEQALQQLNYCTKYTNLKVTFKMQQTQNSNLEFFSALAQILQNHLHIISIKIKFKQLINYEPLVIFLKQLSQSSSITRLDLEINKFPLNELIFQKEQLLFTQFTQLETLSINIADEYNSYNDINDQCLCLQELQNCEQLREVVINLNEIVISEQNLHLILDSINSCKQLTSIRLQLILDEFSSNSADQIIDTIIDSHYLQNLSLTIDIIPKYQNNKLEDTIIIHNESDKNCNMFNSNITNLQLKLNGNCLHNLKYRILRACNNISSLQLLAQESAEKETLLLTTQLQKCINLQSIELIVNLLSSKQAEHYGEALRNYQQLSSVTIQITRFGNYTNEGIVLMQNLLGKCYHIKYLQIIIVENILEFPIIDSLSEIFGKMTLLKTLKLKLNSVQNTRINEFNYKIFGQNIKYCKYLTSIVIDQQSIWKKSKNLNKFNMKLQDLNPQGNENQQQNSKLKLNKSVNLISSAFKKSQSGQYNQKIKKQLISLMEVPQIKKALRLVKIQLN